MTLTSAVEPKTAIDQPANAAGGEQNEPQGAVPGANVKEQEKRPAILLMNDLVLGTNNPAKDAEYWIFAELSNKGGVITKLQLNHYENEDRSGPLVLLQEEIGNLHSYRLTTEHHPEIAETLWEVVDNSPEQVVFRTHIRAGTLQIEKRFSLEKNSPFIKLEVVLRNLSDDPLNDISYTLNNGQGLPIENLHYSNYYRNAVVATAEPGSAAKLSKWSLLDLNFGNAHETKGAPVRFWGVDCQFFASVILIDPNGKSQQRPRIDQAIGVPHPNLDLSSINVFAYLDSIAVPAGDELVHEYLLYNGPKDYTLLDEYPEYDLALLVDGGSFFFLPTKHLSRIVNRVLRFVGSITGDYGFALIITALLVRVVMLPLSHRQLRSRALMQHLQPQISQLKEEYGKDKNGLSKAQMELCGRYGYNPTSGCLPAIAVAILFVAAWHGLNGSFTLRQAEFLWGLTWIHDLSVPDQLFAFGQPSPLL